MKPDQISRKTWAMEFLRMFAASFVGGILIIFLGLYESNLLFFQIVLIYILVAFISAVFLMLSNIEHFKFIFYLRPIYQELLESNSIEQVEIKKTRKKVIRLGIIGSITYGVVFAALMGWYGEEESFAYILLLGLFATLFSAFFSYPERYFKLISELCTPHLDAEAKEYIQPSEESWWKFLIKFSALILVFALISLI